MKYTMKGLDITLFPAGIVDSETSLSASEMMLRSFIFIGFTWIMGFPWHMNSISKYFKFNNLIIHLGQAWSDVSGNSVLMKNNIMSYRMCKFCYLA